MKPLQGKKPVIFCDFDGTITQRDVIITLMEKFAPPVWKEIVDQILNQRTLSIRDGVSQLFRLIPGTQKEAMVAYAKETILFRAGFPEFLEFCQEKTIPFLVVSGGVDFFIEPLLAPYRSQLSIFCNGSIFHEDAIELTFPYLDESCSPCGQCACCKISIMERYPSSNYYRIVVGDSLTDLGIARVADGVFARDKLIDYTQAENIEITPFEDFYAIQAFLEKELLPASSALGASWL
jgi:2-hydroxy-3-keto-5-methylthiopentenyl-1-phosphate phosphatase